MRITKLRQTCISSPRNLLAAKELMRQQPIGVATAWRGLSLASNNPCFSALDVALLVLFGIAEPDAFLQTRGATRFAACVRTPYSLRTSRPLIGAIFTDRL
jgi:hypothetical protein